MPDPRPRTFPAHLRPLRAERDTARPDTAASPPPAENVFPRVSGPRGPRLSLCGGDDGAARRRWRGGETVRMAGRACMLEGDPAERRGTDDAWVLREGTARVVGPNPRPVWFRHVLVRQPGDRGHALLATVDGQLQLLAEIGGRAGLPSLVAGQLTAAEGVLLSARPAGRSWREMFGPPAPRRMPPPDQARAIALLRVAAGVGDVLAALHDSGYSHRAVTPDAVLLPGASRSRPSVVARPVVLRDLGLAAVARLAGEGPAEYRAPEQERYGLPGPRIGPRTDVFRLAAMAYHGLAGVAPGRGGLPAPLRGCRLPFPVAQTLDEVLLRALDLDPNRRPARIRVLADAFRLGAHHLTRMSL
ncbi:hypothetical protein [Candidatus Frankia nodulisporulans]|uniref:hypothetical protein n=1 Tax=Candidatus Frankia nodulisporulans TaxID=2060052 RepID=UPI001583C57E|nr:hypothetical protein [Candidatus Frankia nodulisporulans]